MQIARDHWGTENKLHWCLDVAFNEDACQVYKDHPAENLATLRHLCLNLISQDKKSKGGVKPRRRRAGWDDDYLVQLIGGGNS